jgi:mRNA-degrading endonuclease YafQ of YafQ-DinJ toxin-antitoxin module
MSKSFKKTIKKLHDNQLQDLDDAISKLIENPVSGNLKKGDLVDLRVYKFRMTNELTLLAYYYQNNKLLLSALGSHENFYRDLKK